MRKDQIENWALDIIERVVKSQHIEDSRVELKAEWIEPTKAARRLAGHANASHGDPALWLMGVIERKGDTPPSVPGVKATDFATWYGQVAARFDELAPSVVELAVPYIGKTIMALLWETDRAPYVVKAEDPGGTPRDVPYRHGTRVDTATRSQLLRILVPTVNTPQLEVVTANVAFEVRTNAAGMPYDRCLTTTVECFVVQPQRQQAAFASHRSLIQILIDGIGIAELSDAQFAQMPSLNGSTFTSVAIDGPGHFRVSAHAIFPPTDPILVLDDELVLRLSFDVPNCQNRATTECVVCRERTDGDDALSKYWGFSAY